MAGIADATPFPSGDVTFCELTKPFANLKEADFDLHNLWHSQEANERTRQIRDCFCVHTCNVLHAVKYDTKTLLRLLEESLP